MTHPLRYAIQKDIAAARERLELEQRNQAYYAALMRDDLDLLEFHRGLSRTEGEPPVERTKDTIKITTDLASHLGIRVDIGDIDRNGMIYIDREVFNKYNERQMRPRMFVEQTGMTQANRHRVLDMASMPDCSPSWWHCILIALGLQKRASMLDYLQSLDRWLDKNLAL